MGWSKSSSKREVYSNTILPQETRKTLNREPNLTPKTTEKEQQQQQKKPQKWKKERNHKDLSRNKWKRNERNNSKD